MQGTTSEGWANEEGTVTGTKESALAQKTLQVNACCRIDANCWCPYVDRNVNSVVAVVDACQRYGAE